MTKQLSFIAAFALLFNTIQSATTNYNLLKTKTILIKHKTDSVKLLPKFSKQVPALLVKKRADDDESISLNIKKLKLDVKVIGDIATTIMDITFYNNLNRVLDGEFCFPLGDGQSVSYFAMETDKGLQEASVVEKAKGRTVYESIVRRKIDPALLEWTAGNNFRSRIYPIPAKGVKRILIGFEQKLNTTNDAKIYYQPFFFKNKIDDFAINVEVFNQKIKPQLFGSDKITLSFNNWKENWIAKYEAEDYRPNQPIAFEIPQTKNLIPVYVEKADKGNSAFYFTINPTITLEEKKAPSKVGLIWDASTSANKTDFKSVMECLNAYMKKSGYPSVQLVVFSHEINETFNYKGGESDWKKITNKLSNVIPDGGTQIGCIDLNKYDCDEYIFVSDGMSNFGKHELKTSSKPIHAICASPSVNFSYLKYLSSISGGRYINLNELSSKQAIELLSTLSYHFISAQYDKSILSQVVPSHPVDISNSFSMAGMMEGYTSDVILNFGIGEKILYTEKIKLVNKPEDYHNSISKLWAQKKLEELDVLYEKNKDEIATLAKEYNIVTRNTSLIVLDGLEDYITHKIEPKDSKLKKQYLARMANTIQAKNTNNKYHMDRVVAQFEQLVKWYDKDYVEKIKKDTTNKTGQLNIKKDQKTKTGKIYNGSALNAIEVVSYTVPLIEPETKSGQTFTREEFINLAQKNVNTISSQAAGVYQSDQGGALNYRGSRGDANTYYVDGVRVIGGAGATQLSAVELRTINGGIPAQYGDNLGNKNSSSDIIIKPWSADAAYMQELKQTPKADLYKKYLELKANNSSSPSFFLDVADYFTKQGKDSLALRILSNIAEFDLENAALMRILGHRLMQINETELATSIFEDVLKIKEEEPQSYRDLGLAYEQNKEYQKAIDVLCKVINKEWDSRFPEIETLVAVEINHILALSKNLNLDALDKRLIKQMPCDVRIVLNWDTDNCDMDLWVTDPKAEKCSYSHTFTKSGGKISRDFTGGYGPEVFMLKEAEDGKYKIDVNYFGTRNQSLYGPTTVQAELYTNYGEPNEVKKTITLQLKNNREVINIGELVFKE